MFSTARHSSYRSASCYSLHAANLQFAAGPYTPPPRRKKGAIEGFNKNVDLKETSKMQSFFEMLRYKQQLQVAKLQIMQMQIRKSKRKLKQKSKSNTQKKLFTPKIFTNC